MVKGNVFQKTWKTFCESGTIHGLNQIRQTSYPWKVLWQLFFISALCPTVWLCSNSINRYLLYDVKTTVTYQTVEEIPYPSITFCNKFGLRTNAALSPTVLLFIESIYSDKIDDVPNKIAETLKVCKKPNESLSNDIISQVGSDLTQIDMFTVDKYFSQDSLRDVFKCWWKSKEIDCGGIFANQFLDVGACFTFQPNVQAIHNVETSGFAKAIYGINMSSVKDITSINTGNKNGLQFVLNAAQKEYCDISNKYSGAGFHVVIHEPNDLRQFFSLAPSIYLTPGSVTNVLLKPTNFNRKTAHLGLCSKSVYAYNNMKVYFISICIEICFVTRILEKCNCKPTQFLKGTENFFIANLGINFTKYSTCQERDLPCMKEQQFLTFKSDNLKTDCPECLQPCFETKYDTVISSEKFPSRNLMNYFKHTFNETLSLDIQKNYLVVNFMFENLQIENVLETQAFTLKDLLIYCGNIIFLFLGMSFMGIGDIVQFASFNIVHSFALWKKFKGYKPRNVIFVNERVIFINVDNKALDSRKEKKKLHVQIQNTRNGSKSQNKSDRCS